jgi:hypothetical protein
MAISGGDCNAEKDQTKLPTMKTSIFTLGCFVVLLSQNIFSQCPYQPVNFDHGQWVFTTLTRTGNTEYTCDTLLYYFKGDTIFDNNLYKKLYYSGLSYCTNEQGTECRQVKAFAGAMRNDTINRQVWFNGQLTYDYHLSLWDTMKAGYYKNQVIGAIDSISFCAKYFRRYQFYNVSDQRCLIENIRALDNVICPYEAERGWCRLECYYETDNFDCIPCHIKLGQDDLTPQTLKLYPNPCEDKISVSGLLVSGEIQLYTVSGEMVQRKNIDQTTLELDLTKFTQGVYLVKIITDKMIYTRKIIKKQAW